MTDYSNIKSHPQCAHAAYRCDVGDTSEAAWRVRCEPCNTWVVACSRPHNWSPVQPKKTYEQKQAEYFARLKEELAEEAALQKSTAVVIKRAEHAKK